MDALVSGPVESAHHGMLNLKNLCPHINKKLSYNIIILRYQVSTTFFSPCRLTAAVLRYFSAIHEFYNGIKLERQPLCLTHPSYLLLYYFTLDQNYQDRVIDDSVVSAAVRYLLANQDESGKFLLVGRSHNHYLMVSYVFACDN